MENKDPEELYKQYFDSIDYYCPMPRDWNRIAIKLGEEYAKNHPKIRNIQGLEYWRRIGLPIPRILAAWWPTPDEVKKEFWVRTMVWAARNDLLWVIETADFEKYSLTKEEIAWQNHIREEREKQRTMNRINGTLQRDKTLETVVNEIRAKEEWEFFG